MSNNIELADFVMNVSSAFEKQQDIKPDTIYRSHDEWCSILALTVMAIVRKRYKITLKAEDLRSCATFEDLYNVVRSRQ